MRDGKYRAWNGPHDKGYKMHGYQYRKAPYHPLATTRGYVLEHRLIMENHLGHYLPEGAIIHHKNGVRDDNRLDNLDYLEEQSRHAKHHDTGKRNSNGQFVAASKEFQDKKFRLLNKNTGLMQIFTLSKLISTTFRKSQFEYRGEFTGLHDKNGKEIYEGDIIRQTDINSDMPNAVIEWQSAGAWFGLKFQAGGAWSMQHASMEVIGNIHQHPDLIRKG